MVGITYQQKIKIGSIFPVCTAGLTGKNGQTAAADRLHRRPQGHKNCQTILLIDKKWLLNAKTPLL